MLEAFKMDDVLRPLYQERASYPYTIGILKIDQKPPLSTVAKCFDTVLLTIVKEAEQALLIKHYQYEEQLAALHIVTEKQLNEWILLGSNRKVIEWINTGIIVYDRNDYVHDLKRKLQDGDFSGRQIRMGLEFAKLVKRYMEGKVFFSKKQYLDAYHEAVHALHHLARLAVFQKGLFPEITVWNQLRELEPEIYQLYKELLTSNESVEQKLKLLFLASEFLMHSQTKTGSSHLLNVLSQRECWSIAEMNEHPELQYYGVDLNILISYLVEKKELEVVKAETKGKQLYHRFYQITSTTP